MKLAGIVLRDSPEQCQAVICSRLSIDDFVSEMILPKIDRASIGNRNEDITKVGISLSLRSENSPRAHLSVAPPSATPREKTEPGSLPAPSTAPQPQSTSIRSRRFETISLDELQQYLLDHSMSPGKDEAECIARCRMLEQQLNSSVAAERSSSPEDEAPGETASISDGPSVDKNPGFMKRILSFK